MQKTLTFAIAVLLALTSSGCIANMGDLRDRVGGSDGENVTTAAIDTTEESTTAPPTTNATVQRTPVARISIFGDGGVLVYKSSFQADDVVDPIRVDQDAKLNLIAADSEALERGATLSSYAWSYDGKPVEGAGQASLVADTAGLRVLTLTVTDSNGKSDSQSLKLGVAPKPFDVVTELLTGPVVGGAGAGLPGELTFDLANATDVAAKITKVAFVATPPAACDIILTVTGPDEEEVGSVDATGGGEAETVSGGALATGTYAIEVAGFSCAAPDGVPVVVTVSYTPIVEGLAQDDHGEHAGH